MDIARTTLTIITSSCPRNIICDWVNYIDILDNRMSLTRLGTIAVRIYMLVVTSDGTSPSPATIPIDGLPFWTYAIGDC